MIKYQRLQEFATASALTTMEAVAMGVPRWIALAAPDDGRQIVELVKAMYLPTKHQFQAELRYQFGVWRHEVWNRAPSKRPKRPASLRPSKQKTSGYRTDKAAHQAARQKVNAERMASIAETAWRSRWIKTENGESCQT